VHQRSRERQGDDLCGNIQKRKTGKAEEPTPVGDKLLPEIGQIVVHIAHILS
jgi:hypothetical protein